MSCHAGHRPGRTLLHRPLSFVAIVGRWWPIRSTAKLSFFFWPCTTPLATSPLITFSPRGVLSRKKTRLLENLEKKSNWRDKNRTLLLIAVDHVTVYCQNSGVSSRNQRKKLKRINRWWMTFAYFKSLKKWKKKEFEWVTWILCNGHFFCRWMAGQLFRPICRPSNDVDFC